MGRFNQNSESGSGQPLAFMGPRELHGAREPFSDGHPPSGVSIAPGSALPAAEQAGQAAAPDADGGQDDSGTGGSGQLGSAQNDNGQEDGFGMQPGLQLKFPVQYGLGEYVSFMWEHSGYLIRRRKVGWFMTCWLQVKSTATAALNFVLLGRARRVYEFTLDEHGIIRTCGGGVTLIPWDDVNAIRRYTRGYLLMLQRGTLPLPLRCLDSHQQANMEALAGLLRTLRQS